MPKYFLSDGIICSPYCQQLAIPFLEYFIEGILPNDHEEAYLLKRLVTRYFVEGGILFRKRFNGGTLEMPRDLRSTIGYARGTRGRVWWPSRQKATSPVAAQSWVFLAHHETRCSWMCEDMPYLPSPWESYTHSPHQPSKHDDSLAIPYLGARFNRSDQSTIQGSYLDINGHWILYKVGWGHLPKEGHRPSCCQFHLRAHNLQVWHSSQDCYW